LESASETYTSIANAYQGHKSFSNKQFEPCLEHLLKATKEYPDFLPSRLQLAHAYLELHNWDFAEKISRLVGLICKFININLETKAKLFIKIYILRCSMYDCMITTTNSMGVLNIVIKATHLLL